VLETPGLSNVVVLRVGNVVLIMDEGSALLTRSATGAKYLIALQVLSRAITFSLNQLLLRYISPDVLGLSVQYEVYSISVLFFARESLRIAIQRHADVAGPDSVDKFHQNAQQGRKDKGAAAEKSQALVNLAYIAVFLGTLLSYGLASAYGKSTGGELATHDMPYRRLTLVTYGLASMMELLAEPSFVVVQQKAAYKVRAAAELVGTFARCFTTCALVIVSDKYHLELGVFPFGISQWTYAMSVLFVYIWKVKPIAAAAGFSLLPVPIPTRYLAPLLPLVITILIQLQSYGRGVYCKVLAKTHAEPYGDIVCPGICEAHIDTR
jgi:oligosaccharide translocation protein RFT1